MIKFIDRIPLFQLAIMAVALGLAPFFPQPHLVEKLRWFADGKPLKLIDWFDLLLHGGPVILLALKLMRVVQSGDAAR